MSRDLAIDLGTANVLVYAKGKGIVIREPSVVAVHAEDRRVALAVGEEAKCMLGRTPGNIVAVRPLQDGVIADFDMTEVMLRHFILKAVPRRFSFVSRPRVVICVPNGVTTVERRAVQDAARNAGAKEVHLVEEPMAAAIGAGLPVEDPVGNMIIDIGGGTTEIAVIALGGIVTSKSIRVAGNKLDEAIVNYMKKEHNLAIGDRSAEEIKIAIGTAYPLAKELTIDVRGRDLVSGLPTTLTVNSTEVYGAMRELIASMVEAVKQTLEDTPPELASDIMHRGVILTGGGALLSGLDLLIHEETGLPVLVAETPLDCVVLGAGKMVDDIEFLQRIATGRNM